MKKLFIAALVFVGSFASAQVGFYNYQIRATVNDTLKGADTLIYVIFDGTDTRPWMCSPIISADSLAGTNWGVTIEFQVANWNTGTLNSQKNWRTVSTWTQTFNGGGSNRTFWAIPTPFQVWHRGLRMLVRSTTAEGGSTRALVNADITFKAIRTP